MTTLVAPTMGRQLGIMGDPPGGIGWETYNNHRGQDYFWLSRDPAGSQQIYAANEGRVEIVSADGSYNGGWGNLLRVHHPSGRFYTAYAHIRNGGFAVNNGDYVHPGQLIAHMGDTGEAQGQHLHFELWIDGARVLDPFGVEYYFSHDLPGTNAPQPAKDLDTVAREVIAGDWGNGDDRVARLTAAGYDASAVQDRVNAILYGDTPAPAPTPTELYTSPEPWGEGLIALAERVGVPYSRIQELNPWVGTRPGGWDVVYPSDQIRYQ